jgi:hypothetical protein
VLQINAAEHSLAVGVAALVKDAVLFQQQAVLQVNAAAHSLAVGVAALQQAAAQQWQVLVKDAVLFQQQAVLQGNAAVVDLASVSAYVVEETAAVLYFLAKVPILVLFGALGASWLSAGFGIALLDFAAQFMFGVAIPFPVNPFLPIA